MNVGSKRSIILAILAMSLLPACGGLNPLDRSWHAKFDWQAEEYFDDPQVIALCKAIEKNDIAEIDRLVAAGADVNALGKENMTPLLWAYPDNQPERFKRLLEHGADPNVIVKSDFNTRRQGILPGDSVTHMAAKTRFPNYFDYVFDNGGDPNLINPETKESPIFVVIRASARDRRQRVKKLIELGADLNHIDDSWTTPVMTATAWGGQYDIALDLLEAGADPRITGKDMLMQLIHIVAGEQERRVPHLSPQQQKSFDRLLTWLEDHGESIEKARSDMERWKSWSLSTGEYRRKMEAEIHERKRREAREREQAAKQEQAEP